MVGGRIVQIYRHGDRWWINTADKGEYCAVYVENAEGVKLGDTLWWQGPTVWWVPGQTSSPQPLKKIGSSGVTHPLGKEYQLKFDYEKIAADRRERTLKMKDLLEEWMVAALHEQDKLKVRTAALLLFYKKW